MEGVQGGRVVLLLSNQDLELQQTPQLENSSALVQATIAVMKHHDHRAGCQERVYSAFTSQLIIKGSQDRNSNGTNLETGADAEAMEGCCFLACSSWLAHPAFL